MIYTLSLEPTLVYELKLSSLQSGEIQQADETALRCDNGGLLLASLLKQLQIPAHAICVAPSSAGALLSKKAQELQADASFFHTEDGFLRLDVVLQAQTKTGLQGRGPILSKQALTPLWERLKLLQQDDTLILCGELPRGLEANTYAQILRQTHQNKTPCILAAAGKALLPALEEHPLLVKSDQRELEALFGCPLRESVLLYEMQALEQKGAANVLISCGRQGAYFLNADKAIFHSHISETNWRYPNGSEEALLAGFLACWSPGNAEETALAFGVACSAAAASFKTIDLQKEINRIYPLVQTEVLRSPASSFHTRRTAKQP